MTLDQLRTFVAVARALNMTRAAAELNMTQPAVSAAIAGLEARHDVKLFHRVGRGIELTPAGHAFLPEALRVLDSAAGAARVLDDLSGLRRGALRLTASQTIASYWLPLYLRRFHERYPGVEIAMTIGNTEQALQRVRQGEAELGFAEGAVHDEVIEHWPVGEDELALVQRDPGPAAIDADWLTAATWIVRESGSGTRSSFAEALAARGIDPDGLRIGLVLPSNEAVRTAVEAGTGAAVLSTLVVAASIAAGTLNRLPFDLPSRPFFALRHKQRYRSRAADALLAMLGEPS